MTEEQQQRVVINNRNLLQVSGVEKVESFNEKNIVVITNMGGLNICGKDLHLSSLQLDMGEISICGLISSLAYQENKDMKAKSKNVIGRIFK